MVFRSNQSGLLRELSRHNTVYQEARGRTPAFAPHSRAEDVAVALTNGPAAERLALLRACLREYQERPHSLWTCLLLHSSRALLQGLVVRAKRAGKRGDLEVLATETYLRSAAALPLARLHRGTGLALGRLCRRHFALELARRPAGGHGRGPSLSACPAAGRSPENALIEWLDGASSAALRLAVALELPHACPSDQRRAFERRRKALWRARTKDSRMFDKETLRP